MLYGAEINGVNTLDEYGLMLCADLKIGEPKLKQNLVDIPGGDGALNMSYSPQGRAVYEMRAISFSLFKPCVETERETLVNTLRNLWHGQVVKLVLPNDTTHYWQGILAIGDISGYNKGVIPVSMIAEPYKYAADGTVVEWSPDDVESGDIVTFEAGGEYPLSNVSFPLAPIQEGTGDPSPENVRPISGWTGADVFRTGVNVWDEEWDNGYYDSATGQFVANFNFVASKNPISVKPNTDYYILFPASYVDAYVYKYDINGDYIARIPVSMGGATLNVGDAYYLTFRVQGAAYSDGISINYPSTDHDYHAYNGKVYALTFKDENDNPITVYGGKPTYLGGGNWRLTVTMAEVDLGSLAWTYNSNTQLFFAEVSGKKVGRYNIICSMYPTSTSTSVSGIADKEVAGGGSTVQVLVKDSSYIDAASFTAAVTGQQLVYELATPQTYTITTEELTTLSGQINNVWCDAGEISLPLPYVTLTNDRKAVTPTINAEQAATITFDGTSVSVSAGESIIPQLVLDNSSKEVGVASTGAVTFSYREGSL